MTLQIKLLNLDAVFPIQEAFIADSALMQKEAIYKLSQSRQVAEMVHRTGLVASLLAIVMLLHHGNLCES